MGDLRFALRQMRARPAFHALLILTFGLGIGLNTALFSVVSALLPGYQTWRLVTIRERRGQKEPESPTGATVRFWRQAKSFEQIEAAASDQYNFSGVDLPEVVHALDVTAGYFQVYRARAFLGRTFAPDEDTRGRNRVAVLDYRFWQRKFGGDANVLGRTIRLDRNGYAVIGVMPRDFHPPGSQEASLYVPLVMVDVPAWGFHTVGRLRPGVSLESARAEMAGVSAALVRQDPSQKEMRAVVIPLQEEAQKDRRQQLLTLFGAGLLVLLLACANTGSLLLARAAFRTREFALRVTLGADRWRLARQLLIESLAICGTGGLAGSALAAIVVSLFAEGVRIDWRLEGFAGAMILLSALLSGMAPAMAVMRRDLSRPAGGPKQRRALSLLVVAELAITFVLAAGSLLLLESFLRLQHVDLGYDPHKLLTLMISSPVAAGSDGHEALELYRRLGARLERMPGARAVGFATALPIGGIGMTLRVQVAGRPVAAREAPEALTSVVSAGYFRAMGIPLVSGRDFTEADRKGSARVAVISQAMTRRVFAGTDAVGQKLMVKTFDPNLTTLGNAVEREIVGVVGDVRGENLKAAPPLEVYLPLEQNPVCFAAIAIRTSGDPEAMAVEAQREIAREDADLPASDVRSMEAKIGGALETPLRASELFGGFALLAIGLSVLGVYGVLSYAVTTRRREIGIRMAIGATGGGILRLVLGESLKLAAGGIGLGLASALVGHRWFESQLFGVHATDPLTMAAVSAGLIAVVLAAAAIPARAATQVDPTMAVRSE